MTPERTARMLDLALDEIERLHEEIAAEQRAHDDTRKRLFETQNALTEARACLAASVPRDVHDRLADETISLRTDNATLRFDLKAVRHAASQAREFVVAGKVASAVAELDKVLPCAE